MRLAVVAAVVAAAVLMSLLVLLLCKVLEVEPSKMQGDSFQLNGKTLFILLTYAIFTVGIAAIAHRSFNKGTFLDLGFRGEFLRNFISGNALGVLLAATPMGLTSLVAKSVKVSLAIPPSVSWFTYGAYYIFFLIVLLTLNSLKEEILFRAFPIETLRGRTRPIFIILLTSVLFALIHHIIEPFTVQAFAYRTLFGILACILYWHTESIWSAVGFHNGANWFVCSFQQENASWKVGAIVNSTMSDYPSWLDSILPSLVCTVLIASVLLLIKTGRFRVFFRNKSEPGIDRK
jgi:membrane protease YdiL (CAAX protease family)